MTTTDAMTAADSGGGTRSDDGTFGGVVAAAAVSLGHKNNVLAFLYLFTKFKTRHLLGVSFCLYFCDFGPFGVCVNRMQECVRA
jgi:hypothetical protein